MTHFAVNWLAVGLATLASWLFGAGYYTVLAGPWLTASGRRAEDIDRADYTPYLWSVACLAVMAYFVALLTPLLTGETTVYGGALIGAHMWLGFVVSSMVLNHRYEGRPWALTAINAGYLLAVLLIDGVVIGLFG